MKTYVRPLTSVVRIDETLLAGSGPKGFDISGDGGASGGIRDLTPGQAGDGSVFAKKGMLPFEDN
ncbi:MAG: hypothetical protein SPE56_04880 [Prevotella sp.]|nr:hypothetical protein [Prevotella sp.]